MKKIIRVGDFVSHQNAGKILHAKVVGIELCDDGEKYGTPVNEIDENVSSAVFTLDNDHWCYRNQIVSGWTEAVS